MKESKQKVVVIGGGITGLVSAYSLQQEARKQMLPIDVVLLEAGPRLGGKIQTIKRDGFIIEKGPESFLESRASLVDLAKDLKIEQELVKDTSGTSFVLVRGKLYPIPGGAIKGIPTDLSPFITTGLFSLFGKLRAAADFFLPKSKESEDQSLGHFFRRRLGDEVVENLIEPLLSEIYAGDIDQLSLQATFPQVYEMEQTYGSLVRGMKKKESKRMKVDEKASFLTFKNGLQSFVERLEASLNEGSVLKGSKATRVEKENQRYAITINESFQLYADAVVVALPHKAACTLFSNYAFLNPLKEMTSTSVATVTVAFDEDAFDHGMEGSSFVISRNSDYTITACTVSNRKWSHSAPAGKILLRCYVGRIHHETIVDLSDEEITKIVLEDLHRLMKIKKKPLFSVISRWKNAMPQYVVGHTERVKSVKQQFREHLPGIVLCGSSFEGISMPDCIDQGENAAQEILQYLQLKNNKDEVLVKQ
ncbi:MAG: protoporphyrinogen oxidase [Bacillus sp. (in: firmicutes)]